MENDISGGGWRRRASAFDGGDGQRFALAFEGGDGRQLWQRWMIETAFVVIDGGSRIRWRSMALAMDYDERKRGRCEDRQRNNQPARWEDKRPVQREETRDDGATTSWCNETVVRGSTTRGQDNERAARREATQQPHLYCSVHCCCTRS